MIRPVRKEDARELCDIYNYYVQNTVITFEQEPVSPDAMADRIAEIAGRYPWIVYEEGGSISGYAYAGRWKEREAYRFSVESTVYVRHDAIGRGVGTKLYERLLEELRQQNIHAVIGGIALPNDQSRKLHEKFGFINVAHFSQVGFKFNRWIDVGYWELLLSKRQ